MEQTVTTYRRKPLTECTDAELAHAAKLWCKTVFYEGAHTVKDKQVKLTSMAEDIKKEITRRMESKNGATKTTPDNI